MKKPASARRSSGNLYVSPLDGSDSLERHLVAPPVSDIQIFDVGATENGDFEEIAADVREQLVILAETESLPRHIGIAGPDMDADVLEAITDLLLAADQTDEGSAALEAFGETSQFDEFPEGINRAMTRMNELYDIVQEAN